MLLCPELASPAGVLQRNDTAREGEGDHVGPPLARWYVLGADHLGHPVVEMPAVNRTALDKVTWPALPGGAP